jgi:S-adenosylmethionine:tRNA ribosyltransferase-isomerase
MPKLLEKSSYYYDLPRQLIAQYPLTDRPQSRLMVLDRTIQSIAHKHFYDIVDLLRTGDVLVVNQTKVIPARLFGKKANGTEIEVFLLHRIADKTWKCLVHPGKRIKQEQMLYFSDDLCGDISLSDEEGLRDITFTYEKDFWTILDEIGHIPLPPYIDRTDDATDHNTYQTVYAKDNGSVAAPTAGLHFNREIMDKLAAKGVILAELILHVGLGTFRPVKTDNITHHVMHSEFCIVPEATASIVNLAKQENRRVIAVGTTSTRTLESFAKDGLLETGEKWTNIFIYPGKRFQIIDGMITNFHLPESTLIMMIAALAGYDFTMQAYKEAIEQEYRFFSYGDAMLIV